MITREIAQLMAEESLLSDELRIIATEAKALAKQDRQSLVKGAELIENMLAVYGRLYNSHAEALSQLQATQDRLREAHALLAKSNAFMPLVATATITEWRV